MDKKVMVVDDDPDILILLRDILEMLDYKVLTVDSGKDCIEELERGFKGVVLIDLVMPFMDGWDTIREIIRKGLHKGIVISIITANGSSNRKKMQGLETYIYDYISKPFDREELLSTLEHMHNIKDKEAVED
ncbi:MAG: response regulator [Candidatus Thermoplasmatota archaeon]